MIVQLALNDLLRLEKHAQFPMPNLENPLYIVKGSVVDGKLIGSFWVKMTTETSMILDPEASKFAKARAIQEIVVFLRKELQRFGFDDSHLFITKDPDYVEFLKRNFGFIDGIGTPLYIKK